MDHTRVEEDDPRRCQAVNSQGQCRLIATVNDDGTYNANCAAHGGAGQANQVKRKELRNYQLDRWRAKLIAKSENSNIKSLRDEIGILRIIMEERLNRCKDAHDLILQSGPISDLVLKIDKVVNSCHKLEASMGELLDKSALLQFAGEVIQIVGRYVPDDDLPKVADEIIESLQR